MKTTEPTPQYSQDDFVMLGVNLIAYIKPVELEGKRAFAIHAADGTPIKLLADQNLALATIRQNNLEPLWVH